VQHLVMHDEAASTDVESVSKYEVELSDLANINKSRHLILIRLGCFGNGCPTQCMYTNLKKNYQATRLQNRLTVVIGSNATDDFKVEPLVVYHKRFKECYQSLFTIYMANKLQSLGDLKY